MSNRFDSAIDTEWKFRRIEGAVSGQPHDPEFDDSLWDNVVLPHTPRIEPYAVRRPWQGVCWYRRDLEADKSWQGKRVSLVFGAAMQIADIWVNGVHKTRHLGGYLPIVVDVTDGLRFDRPNSVAVRLDNRDTVECPPGKPTDDLDFFYCGGLYRSVRLVVTEPVHISDAVAAGIEAGGGVFVSYDEVSAARAVVRVKTHVVNDSGEIARRCVVTTKIVDEFGGVAACGKSEPVMIADNGGHQFVQTVTVDHPLLWHPDRPHLYSLETTVLKQGVVVDTTSTRIGIRRIEVGNRLKINGDECHIRGTNRHQEYPYVGYAVSANAQRRDAIKIKEAGFNFVRLAHYPQDPAFLDACDDLGIMVQAPIPGWQIFHENNSFVASSFQNIRELIRRDRNHPCVVFWEPNFNETHGDHTDWCRAAYEIAHAEYPGDQCFTWGDDYPSGWSGWDVKGLVREYGDWAFGGNESTSRQPRGAGEEPLLQQAWNFQWTLNYLSKALEDPEQCYLGCATWLMFDHNRGYYHEPNYCGMTDMVRLPKFVYHFYRSQADPSPHRLGKVNSLPLAGRGSDAYHEPMAFIANYWTPRESPTKVVVFSNCDEIELFVNGRSVGRRKPDSGPDTAYSPKKQGNLATIGDDVDTSGGNPFDGGNSRHLKHPPFTFMDLDYEPGELSAVGYLAGHEAAHAVVRTPGSPAGIEIVFDTAGVDLVSDGVDAVFVHARIIDADGTLVPDARLPISFEVTGPGSMIGASAPHVEGGIASALLRAGLQPGAITVTALCRELGVATATISTLPSSQSVPIPLTPALNGASTNGVDRSVKSLVD